MNQKREIRFLGVFTQIFKVNSYFSGYLLNCKTGERISVPYQYGYGGYYRDVSLKIMKDNGWFEWDDLLHLYERNNEYPIEWVMIDVKSKKKMI